MHTSHGRTHGINLPVCIAENDAATPTVHNSTHKRVLSNERTGVAGIGRSRAPRIRHIATICRNNISQQYVATICRNKHKHRSNHRKGIFFRFFRCFLRSPLPSTSQNFNFSKLNLFLFYPLQNGRITCYDTGPRGTVSPETAPADLFRFGAAVRWIRPLIICFAVHTVRGSAADFQATAAKSPTSATDIKRF